MGSRRTKELEGKLGLWMLKRLQRNLEAKSTEDAERTGARLGRLMMRVIKKRRERALANLEIAFPEKTPQERVSIAEKAFEHFGIVTADFLRIPRRTKEEVLESMTVFGLEHLESALAGGKGALLITGHFGNWERLSTWLGLKGYVLNVVARDADQQGVNSRVNELREFAGVKVIPRGNAARPIIEALRRNEIVGILPDQNSDEIYLEFFGKPAGTVLGPGVISARTGAPVVPGYCIRTGPGAYRTTFSPALTPLGDEGVRGESMMRAIHASLEYAIRANPEQWLWFHDRWRNARKKGLL